MGGVESDFEAGWQWVAVEVGEDSLHAVDGLSKPGHCLAGIDVGDRSDLGMALQFGLQLEESVVLEAVDQVAGDLHILAPAVHDAAEIAQHKEEGSGQEEYRGYGRSGRF